MKTIIFNISLLILFTLASCGQVQQPASTGTVQSYNDSLILSDTIPDYLLLGRFNPAKEKGFSPIDPKVSNKTGIFLRTEAYEAFLAMRDSALKDGITLIIVSATRTFESQKMIWENKWNGRQYVGGKLLNVSIPDPVQRALEILKYSSMPGTSRHHWGTDIDINSVDPAYFKTAYGIKVLQWLETHAAHFGFCRPYTTFGDTRKTGFQPEEWHWSYIPIAYRFQQAYKKQINYLDLEGFDGDETVFSVRVIENYVLGVDSVCWK